LNQNLGQAENIPETNTLSCRKHKHKTTHETLRLRGAKTLPKPRNSVTFSVTSALA